MAKVSVHVSTIGYTVDIFIQDSSQTIIAGLTGLTSASSGLTAYYLRQGDSSTTAITLSAGTLGTWSSGGFVEIDNSHMKGMYQIGLPNAVLASGKTTKVYIQGAANMAPTVLEIELTQTDNQNAITGGMTALPSVVAGANGGIPLGDASGNVGLKALAIDLPNMTPTAKSLMIRAYLTVTGTTTGPVTADQYFTSGFYNNAGVYTPTYQSTALGTTVYAWTDGSRWYLTTTTPGTGPTGNYFQTAAAATVVGPYTAVNSATGTPAVAAHGNAILSSFQPDVASTGIATPTNITAGTITTVATTTNLTNAPTAGDFTTTMKTSLNAATPASIVGNVGGVSGVTFNTSVPNLAQIVAAQPTDASITSDVEAALTFQGYTTTRAGFLDTLNGLVAAVWAAATRTLTAFGFTVPATVAGNVGGIAGVTFNGSVPSLAQIQAGLPTAAQNRAEMDANSTQLQAIVAALPACFIGATVNDTGATSTVFKGSAGLSSIDGFYVNTFLTFTGSALLSPLPRKVTGYVGSTRQFTFATAFPSAPTNGDTFIVLGDVSS